MRLSELIAVLPKKESLRKQGPEVEITGITHSSTAVQPGHLFVCIEGYKTDGHRYAPQAVEKGAPAILVSKDVAGLSGDVVQVKVPDTRIAEAYLAAKFYDYPTRKMPVIGITGTNGKTTTTYLLESILQTAGHRPGIMGTIAYRYAGKLIPAKNTTPSSLELNQMMAQMVEVGCDYLVMEVSSHALAQGRVEGIDFDVGIFTNLTRDHLDFHNTLEEYLKAKCLLFVKLGEGFDKKYPKFAVVNMDDQYATQVIAASTVPVVKYGVSSDADIRAANIVQRPEGLHFDLITPKGKAEIQLRLPGLFNVYNALAATAALSKTEISLAQIKLGLESLSVVPGRFQSVDCGQDFMVFVDYAHTEDALSNLLRSARQLTNQKLIIVFGCGGDRDRGKRPKMGEVAAKLADLVIVTSDNPRSEDPARIALDIEIGIKRVTNETDKYQIVLARKTAIITAINIAKKGDVVVIAGKGHENEQVFANRTIPFDDAEIATEILKKMIPQIMK
ncbi:MAG: UDP-N-acetylmuramoyl-L-alanyl-D-glutamate--2,6-diaminopimelate ligase [bacterium]|nr:UDP-N-acetylmuramoyl-L-alanyl-D-glutamate--2,6-diaminopimelate ligase [bacterium]